MEIQDQHMSCCIFVARSRRRCETLSKLRISAISISGPAVSTGGCEVIKYAVGVLAGALVLAAPQQRLAARTQTSAANAAAPTTPESQRALINQYCIGCHSDADRNS